MQRQRRGYTILEIAITLLVVAVLMSLLIPLLQAARSAAQGSVCSANLRQIGVGWISYAQDRESFPRHAGLPEWGFGGARIGSVVRDDSGDLVATADPNRPINEYIVDGTSRESASASIRVFACPADAGVWVRDESPQSASILGGRSCFESFGTSYRANPLLVDAHMAGLDIESRPLKLAEVTQTASRLVLLGDPIWLYATDQSEGTKLDASWHSRPLAGHVALLDGSVRFASFADGTLGTLSAEPRIGD
ncbi:MAG: DUF1559 domain-containing protein [Planctomycetota bacterium]